MSILPRLSTATKLYAIFALLAIATVALAAVAVINARHHDVLTQEFEAASHGAKHIERLNGLLNEHVRRGGSVLLTSHLGVSTAMLRPREVNLDQYA